MDIVLIILALLLAYFGYFCCIVPILPGQFVTYAGLTCLCFIDGVEIHAFWPIVFALLTIGATLLDFILPSIMAKQFGGTKAGEVGAFVGMIIGMIVGLFLNIYGGVIAIVLAPFFGALIGELIYDHHQIKRAFKSGLGSFISFFVGAGVKLLVSFFMILYIWWKIIEYCIVAYQEFSKTEFFQSLTEYFSFLQ